jgi:integral membrane sensor domain MASE1
VGRWTFVVRAPSGDIRIKRENVRIYIPVIPMLLISVAASLLVSVLQYLFQRKARGLSVADNRWRRA